MSVRLIGAVDPGPKCGVAILELAPGAGVVIRVRVVEAFTLLLCDLYHSLRPRLEAMTPTPMLWVVEGVSTMRRTQGNTYAARRVGYNVGYVVASMNALVGWCEALTPNEWRAKLGLGRSCKKQAAWSFVQNLVTDFDKATNEHERDAVCIALAGQGFLVDRVS